GLVKKYAFVDVEQYQIVGTGDKLEAARTAYIEKLKAGDLIGDETGDGEEEKPETTYNGTIAEIHPVVQNGNTVYYFRLNEVGGTFTADITVSHELPFLKAGDLVTITCDEGTTVVKTLTLT
ncbi:MAG: hypothetical protein IKT44_04465, partial [Clostridia bacterium]|nr:hypothetical protein [Clostridia bacterium]